MILSILILYIAYGLNEDVPEYDLDNEDEKWLELFNKKKVVWHCSVCCVVFPSYNVQ